MWNIILECDHSDFILCFTLVFCCFLVTIEIAFFFFFIFIFFGVKISIPNQLFKLLSSKDSIWGRKRRVEFWFLPLHWAAPRVWAGSAVPIPVHPEVPASKNEPDRLPCWLSCRLCIILSKWFSTIWSLGLKNHLKSLRLYVAPGGRWE